MTGDPIGVGAGRDLAHHLEEKVVLGPPQPTGGDDLLRLILPDLDQSSLEEGLGDRRRGTAMSKTGTERWRLPPTGDRSERTNKGAGDSSVR